MPIHTPIYKLQRNVTLLKLEYCCRPPSICISKQVPTIICNGTHVYEYYII